ncbi:uncharacterized protein RSE6_08698 [Rhynchosporium secalis]|uniref:Uncharacterized protein n=1 Tax=Rhynchosporium secalis TaxID=38038 RepID=A0A1E1MG14_RHYSE|nr:uncharacterized protein RSE6_08698 [Rhynchosporium secalis]
MAGYLKMLLNPVRSFTELRSLLWPTSVGSYLDTEKTRVSHYCTSCPESSKAIGSQKWTKYVGGTASVPSPVDAAEYSCCGGDTDHQSCSIFGSECAAIHRCFRESEQFKIDVGSRTASHFGTRVPNVDTTPSALKTEMKSLILECTHVRNLTPTTDQKRTTPFGEEILGELYVPRYQRAVSDIFAGRNGSADGEDNTSEQVPRMEPCQYRPISNLILEEDSLLTRQIKTCGVPIDPYSTPAVTNTGPCRPKAVAPKGYHITHAKPRDVAKKEVAVGQGYLEVTNARRVVGNQWMDGV